tara:strand:- start:131 stop:385 length:255 start_codon:yes stop_codon:yes gene_type:complete
MSKTKGYVIIDSSELEGDLIDFSVLPFTSKEKLRYSVDKSKALIKFFGDKPSFLQGNDHYTYNEIVVILKGSDWQEEPDIVDQQ